MGLRMWREKNLAHTGTTTSILPARSLSLYRLSYPGSWESTAVVKIVDLESLTDLRVFSPPEYENAVLGKSSQSMIYVCMYVWVDGWVDMSLASARAFELILFTFGVYEFILHSSMLREDEHSNSKSRFPNIKLKFCRNNSNDCY
jgi:hypothetical protein